MIVKTALSRLVLGLGLAGFLAACTGGTDNIETQAGALEEIRKSVQASRKAQEPQEIVLSRALLNELTVPSLEAIAEARDQTAYLVPFSRRGNVTIWRTADNGQLVLRRGLLTGTRGLGGDLVSSDYGQTLSALMQGSGATSRRLFVRNGNAGEDVLTLNCRTESLGRVRLDVVGRSYDTRHLRETCTFAQGRIENEYWIELRSGLIRQSRQWAGPSVGHLRLRLLKSASE